MSVTRAANVSRSSCYDDLYVTSELTTLEISEHLRVLRLTVWFPPIIFVSISATKTQKLVPKMSCHLSHGTFKSTHLLCYSLWEWLLTFLTVASLGRQGTGHPRRQHPGGVTLMEVWISFCGWIYNNIGQMMRWKGGEAASGDGSL